MLAFILDPYGMEDAVDRIVAEAGGGHVQRKVPAQLVGGGLRPQFDVAAKERVVRFDIGRPLERPQCDFTTDKLPHTEEFAFRPRNNPWADKIVMPRA